MAVSAHADEITSNTTPLPYPPVFSHIVNGTSIITAAPTHLIIQCQKGSVDIEFDTGKVILKDCTVDEASQVFWKQFATLIPVCRKDWE